MNLLRGHAQLFGGHVLAFGMDDFGAALAFGFGLTGDGADHLVRQVHLFDFHHGYFDAPRPGVLVEYPLQADINSFALAEQFVQLDLAQDAAERGLSKLTGNVQVIVNFYDRLYRLHHAEINHGIDFHGYVIACHQVLRRNFHGFHPQRDASDSI